MLADGFLGAVDTRMAQLDVIPIYCVLLEMLRNNDFAMIGNELIGFSLGMVSL